MKHEKEIAVFGGGCFWCTEAIFQAVPGVNSVVPGYAGGTKENPTYEEVCSGATGHAEAVKIAYDAAITDYRKLLEIFFTMHDSTTVDRQGNDIGSQYRSVIFFTTEKQRSQAVGYIKDLTDRSVYDKPVVTTVEPLERFYEAEDYHHDYFHNHSEQPYCRIVIGPKLEKFRRKFAK